MEDKEHFVEVNKMQKKYIDADRLNYLLDELCVADGIYESIQRLPAADVVEINRGHWEICCDGYYPYCSVCKEEPQGRVMTGYCPNCGAKMDGERDG